jgi:hypothetical protein
MAANGARDATIYLIRHAEKPVGDIKGVDQNGAHDDASLIPRGWERAGAWSVFFGPGGQLASPERIYAADDRKDKIAKDDKEGSHSKRPTETVTELVLRLGQKVDVKYTKGQEADLVGEIKTWAGVTLICWQHEAIPEIAELLVGSNVAIPSPWPGNRFDVVWRFRKASGATTWTFDQVCPQLLSGDPAQPIT